MIGRYIILTKDGIHANPYCFIKTMGLFLLFTSIKTMKIATSKCILYQTIHRACLYFTN